MSLEVGAVINEQYKIVEHIGRGGMADVWSARDTRLRRLVAIKTIAAGLAPEADPVTLFEQEARTIARMEHPHILPIHDFGDHEGKLYIVMRYITGGSLEDRLRNGPIDARTTLRITESVARALDYAHENNVIHLDLKPPNILLDSAGSPYLADFGLATVLDPEGRARNPGSGTLLYMAPEQLTAEVIDLRADIYSFGLLLFHMLTGELPYEGQQSLAMRQIAQDDKLPFLEAINEEIPPEATEILREATAIDPDVRPESHMAIVDDLRAILEPASVDARAQAGSAAFYEMATSVPASDGRVQHEEVSIYQQAHAAWHGGQGRFLPGVTHFMLMSDFYRKVNENEVTEHNVTIDDEGYQLLLRGAIEYDYDLDYWWSQVDGDNHRRWVCLHALRSGNAPARIRALEFLQPLPDDPDDPVIPRLVGQALATENNPDAQLAALKVLSVRAGLQTPEAPSTEQTTVTRFLRQMGLQNSAPALWRDHVYSQDIDTLIAETAFDDNHEVAEEAARTIGRIRSLAGVRYIADAQHNNRDDALDALAYIRDEAPALPDDVSRQGRFYAWISNSVRRITDHPLEGILRFVLVLLGGWLAMGEQVYNTFLAQQMFSPERWGSTISVGLVFGLFVAITVLVADELSERLRGFWPWWMRLSVFGLLGFGFSVLTFSGFTWLNFFYLPQWDLMRLGGFALAFGFVLSPLLRLSGWQSVLLVTGVTFAGVYAAHAHYYNTQDFSVWPAALLGLLLGGACGWRAAYLNSDLTDYTDRTLARDAFWMTLMSVVGVGLGLAAWYLYAQVFTGHVSGESPITWDTVLLLFIAGFTPGVLLAYLLPTRPRLALFSSATAAFLTIGAAIGWQFSADTPFAPRPNTTFFYFGTGDESLIFSVTLPALLVLALGAYGRSLLRGWLGWIGEPQKNHEIDGWFRGAMLYAILTTAVISVLALFSLKTSIVWALGWSLWAFVTFVAALATWKRARWGANLLIGCAILLIAGGFVFDIGSSLLTSAVYDRSPPLLDTLTLTPGSLTISLTVLQFWAVWAMLLGVATWGAQRRYLWGGIGLVALLMGWYIVAIFTAIPGSVTTLSLTSVALVLYALSPAYDTMEHGRFQWPVQRSVDAYPAADLAPAVSAPVNLTTERAVDNRTGRMATPDTMKTVLDTPTASQTGADMATDDTSQSDVLPDVATRLDAADSIPDTMKLDTGAVKFDIQSDDPDGTASDDDNTPQTVRLDTSAVSSGRTTNDTDNTDDASDDTDETGDFINIADNDTLPDIDTRVFPALEKNDDDATDAAETENKEDAGHRAKTTPEPEMTLDTSAVRSAKPDEPDDTDHPDDRKPPAD
jgi:serine/threonine protein kinase